MKKEAIHLMCDALEKDRVYLVKRSAQFSSWRLVMILLVLFALYEGWDHAFAVYYGFAIIGIVIFFILAKKHSALKKVLEEKEVLIEVYQDILKRKDDEWKTFEDSGEEYLNEETTQAYDLDVFGKASLFQFVNTAKTVFGKDTLAVWLSPNSAQKEDVLERQEAVQECIDKESFTTHMVKISKLFAKHARKAKKKKLNSFLAFIEKEDKKTNPIVMSISYVFPVITIIATMLASMQIWNAAIALSAFVISLIICMLTFMQHGSQLASVEDMRDMIKDYEQMFVMLEKQDFHSAFLIKQHLAVEVASGALKELNRILGWVRVRNNSVMYLFVNGFCMLDFHCVRAINQWKQQYGNHVRSWLEAIGNVEAIVSLAQLAYAKDTCCFGMWSDSLYVSMQEGTHPLLSEEKAVKNSLDLQHGSYVITGSNMSGKTTFLRTIGMNMILFRAGAPVCATSFTGSGVDIYTSMRVQDNVSEGISTFYAEILRIKQMMDASKQTQPMMVFIDEIFKGTNSADRILCATEAIKKLHLPHVITMVSTHDFELCDLEYDNQVQAKNYHFSEYYEADAICFDYTLKDGRCTTTNAKQLMKLAGF